METLTTGSTNSLYGGASEPNQLEETVNYVNNFRQGNNPYSNTYNPGWRNHPNFSWSNNSGQKNYPPPGFQQQNKGHEFEKEPDMKEWIAEMFKKQQAAYDAILQSQSASIKALENQIGQLANAQSYRPPGNLPSNTELNPRNRWKE